MDLFLRRLRRAGYSTRAHRVDSPDGLRHALQTDRWQAAIVDYVIPGFSGREALAILADEAPDLPTIVASGHAPEELIAETARLGAVDYLIKDDLARVVPAVEHAVRERDARVAKRVSDRRLRDRERTLSTLFANLPGMVYRCAYVPEWTVEFVSDGIRDVLALEPSDLLPGGRFSWGDIIHEDDRAAVWAATSAGVDRHEPYTLTYRMRAGDGSVRWVWERGRAVYRDDGGVEALEGFVLDVTEQRRAELALEETRARMEHLLNATNAVVYSLPADPPHLATFLGANVWDLLGYSSDEITADDAFWAHHTHPDDLPLVEGLYDAVLEHGHVAAEYRFLTGDGHYHWLRDEMQLSRDESGSPAEIVGQFWDITERREAEEALQASERRLALRSRIAEAFLTSEGEDVFRAVLTIVLDVIASPEGLFGYLDDEQALVLPYPVGDPMSLLPASVGGSAADASREGRHLRLPAGTWGDSVWSRAVVTGATQIVESEADTEGQGPARALASPIVYAGNVFGVLAVAGRPAPYSADDAHSLDEVASYVAPILREWLQRTSFETALFESQQQLTLRNQVADVLLTAPDAELFTRVLDIVQEAFDSPLGMFGHLDESGDLVAPHMSAGVFAPDRPESSRTVMHPDEWEGTPWGAVLRSGTTQRFEAPSHTPAGHAPIETAVAVPLVHAEDVIGVIAIANRPGGYGDQEVATLEALAAYVAPVLSARLSRSAAEEATARSAARLRRTVDGVVAAMGTLVDMRDPYTAGHERRVATLALQIGRELDLSSDDLDTLRMAAQVHDVGKMAVPAEILSRPGRLQPTEYSIIKTHPKVGYDILSAVDFDLPIAEMVLQHHERLDGSGYPDGLKGDEIMLGARVLAVADVVEAMASHRPYRPALGLETALAEIESNAGVLYDADAVSACLTVVARPGFSFD